MGKRGGWGGCVLEENCIAGGVLVLAGRLYPRETAPATARRRGKLSLGFVTRSPSLRIVAGDPAGVWGGPSRDVPEFSHGS